MSNLHKAVAAALEALEGVLDTYGEPLDLLSISGGAYEALQCRDAITALRAALAEPEPTVAENATTQQQLEQAPPSEYRRGYWDGFAIGKREGRIEAEDALAEPVHEPVAYWHKRGQDDEQFIHAEAVNGDCPDCVPLYTAPPQRKPLPASEIVTMYDESPTGDSDMIAFARAIERAHGIKGGA